MTNRSRVLRAAAAGHGRTLRELAVAAGLDLACARRTVRGLRRDGALSIVGTRREAHCVHPVALYAAFTAAHDSPYARLWSAWFAPAQAWAVAPQG